MRRVWVSLIFVLAISLTFVSAANCELSVTMLNQDPYPAVPGDYVEMVFQIAGIENPECGTVVFSLVEKYPLVFDPGMDATVTIDSGTFTKDYSASKIIPYKVRVDENAINGNSPIEVSFSSKGYGNRSYLTKSFDLSIEDVKADFEIFVKDYNFGTNIMTFEVLNIADADIEALTFEIPSQDGVVVKGSNRNILGDLDSNEYTSAEFELRSSINKIDVNLLYTDKIGVRRSMSKVVSYDSDYFVGRKADSSGRSVLTYVIWAAVILFVVYFVYKKFKKKKQHHKA